MPVFEIVESIPPKPPGNFKGSHIYQAVKSLSFMDQGKILKIDCGEVKPLMAQAKIHLWARQNFAIRISTTIRGNDIYVTKL
jgi:hypothetical protein